MPLESKVWISYLHELVNALCMSICQNVFLDFQGNDQTIGLWAHMTKMNFAVISVKFMIVRNFIRLIY